MASDWSESEYDEEERSPWSEGCIAVLLGLFGIWELAGAGIGWLIGRTWVGALAGAGVAFAPIGFIGLFLLIFAAAFAYVPTGT